MGPFEAFEALLVKPKPEKIKSKKNPSPHCIFYPQKQERERRACHCHLHHTAASNPSTTCTTWSTKRSGRLPLMTLVENFKLLKATATHCCCTSVHTEANWHKKVLQLPLSLLDAVPQTCPMLCHCNATGSLWSCTTPPSNGGNLRRKLIAHPIWVPSASLAFDEFLPDPLRNKQTPSRPIWPPLPELTWNSRYLVCYKIVAWK